jgi:tungstate transport system substrate-binding protein
MTMRPCSRRSAIGMALFFAVLQALAASPYAAAAHGATAHGATAHGATAHGAAAHADAAHADAAHADDPHGATPPLPSLQNDTRCRQVVPTELYGAPLAPHTLRIGNGGAGATGMLRALATAFLTTLADPSCCNVAWYQNISRHTLKNLAEGRIDLSLTYEREPECAAVAAGWASTRRLAFYDHFVVVGPHQNPAGLAPQHSVAQAFARIRIYGRSAHRAVFLSRHDASGTNNRERSIWESLGETPWSSGEPWYVVASQFPDAALLQAAQQGLYTLTDRATYLHSRRRLGGLQLLVQGGEALLNPCHVLLGRDPTPLAQLFWRFLLGPDGQQILATYGAASAGETPYFSSAGAEAGAAVSARTGTKVGS